MAAREVPPAPPGGGSLKRDPALVELSRDHHHALVHALELRRAREAISMGAATATARAFLEFAASDLNGHFADEETEMLPVAETVAPDETARVRAEHAEIRDAIERLRAVVAGESDARPLLGEVGDRLHDHVRYEERVLFERLQERLAPEELAGLGRRLDEHRRSRGLAPGCRLPG